MYKGALFFDCDGTLLDEEEGIFTPTDKTLRTLEKLRTNGYLTFIATGRPKRLTVGISNYVTGIITSNGAYIEADGVCIRSIEYDKKLLPLLTDFMDKNKIFYSLETQNRSYIKPNPNKAFSDTVELFHFPKSMFSSYKENLDLPINKISIYYDDISDVNRLKEAFADEIQIHLYRSCNAADLDMCGVSKGDSAKFIMNKFGIDVNNSYAFGDGGNDYNLLKAVGHGVAMHKHSEVLNGVAEFFTKSVKDDGVAYAICDRYGLV